MQRRAYLRAVSAAGVAALAGCSSGDDDRGTTPDDTPTGTGTSTGATASAATTAEAQPDPMTFSGTAPAQSRWGGVAIDGGLTVVEATHDGSGEFGVSLVADGGDRDEHRFVDATGNYDGVAAELVAAGEYVLHVEKDGFWEVVVRQPRPKSGDPLPVSPSGAGPAVPGPFEFEGTHTATLSHDGQGDPRVRVLPVEGGSEEVLFDGTGNGEETTFEHSGIGYVDVAADGDWSLDLQ